MDCVWTDDEGSKRSVTKLVLCWTFDKVLSISSVSNALIGDNLDSSETENRTDVDLAKFKVNELFVVEISCNEDRKFSLDIDTCWLSSSKSDFDEEIIVDFKGGWVTIDKSKILLVISDLDNDWAWESIIEARGAEVDIEEKSSELGLISVFVEIFVSVEVSSEGVNGIKSVEYPELLEVWVSGKKSVENEEILLETYTTLSVLCWFITPDDRTTDWESTDDLVKAEGDCTPVTDGDKNVVDKGRVDVSGSVLITLLEDSIATWELGCRVEFELLSTNSIDEVNCDTFDCCRSVDVLLG